MDEELKRYRIDVAARYLDRIRGLGIRVKTLEAEIDELRADLEGVGAMDYTRERVSKSPAGDRMAEGVGRLFDRLDTFLDELREFEDERQRARECLDRLEDPVDHAILVRRYLLGEQFRTIAEELHVELVTVYKRRRSALDAFYDVMPAQERDRLPDAFG